MYRNITLAILTTSTATLLLTPRESFAAYSIGSFANIEYHGLAPLPPTVYDSHNFTDFYPVVNNVLSLANSRVDTASSSIRVLSEAAAKSEFGLAAVSYGSSTLCFSQCLDPFSGYGGAGAGFSQSFNLASPLTDGYATFITELTGTFTGSFPRLGAYMSIMDENYNSYLASLEASIDQQGHIFAHNSGAGTKKIEESSYGKFIFVNTIPLSRFSSHNFTFNMSIESYVPNTHSSEYYTLTTKLMLPFGTKLQTDDGTLLSKVTTYNATGLYSSAVPEPANWVMLIVGFGAAGAAMRRSKCERLKLA